MNDEDAARSRAKLNDADYITRLKARDEEASDEFIEWMYKTLPGHIAHKFSQTRAEAEDLASICVTHILGKLDKFKPVGRGSFPWWLYRVVYNKVLNELDKRKRAEGGRLVPLDEFEDKIRDFIHINLFEYEAAILNRLESEEGEENKIVRPEIRELRRCFFTLSKPDRRILLLRNVGEFKYEKIARDDLDKEGKPITEKTLKAKSDSLRKRYERAVERAQRCKEESS